MIGLIANLLFQERKLKAGEITFHRKNLPNFEISAKSNYNFEKPFLWLARKFVGYVLRRSSEQRTDLCGLLSSDSLEFVAAPALAPAEVEVDAALMEQYANELRVVSHYDQSTIKPLVHRDCCLLGRVCPPSGRRRRPVNFFLLSNATYALLRLI